MDDSNKQPLKLWQIMLVNGWATPDQIKQAAAIQKQDSSKSLAEILISMGITDEINVLKALSERMDVPLIEGPIFVEDTDIIKKLPEKIARRHNVVPVKIEKGQIIVALRDPSNIDIAEDIKMAAGMEVGYVLATSKAISDAIEKYYANISAQRIAEGAESDIKESQSAVLGDSDSRVDNAPIVKLLNTLVQQAYLRNASDIHIEPFRDTVLIRMRIDGDLQEYLRVTPAAHRNLITRLKILAAMNIAEKRIPLDGRFEYKYAEQGVDIDIRVSTLPTTYGEKAVLRLLGTALGKNTKLSDLGMTESNVKKFSRICSAPNGVILVTGPTGSGKSTTLYTVLNDLNKPSVNTTTVEDPVEKHVFGLNQVQVNAKAGLTFAAALRSILRQDPDIVMIGEIRDYETAEIAMRASITGHLVLSTLHTNDAVSSIVRLIDMGVPPYLVAAAVNGVVAQRLIKLLCPKCKRKERTTEVQRKIINDKTMLESYVAVGCASCNFTGYVGRTAVHEVLEIDTEMRELITRNVSVEEMKKHAESQGTVYMDTNVRELVRQGKTSIAEYMRIIYTMY